MEYPIHRKELIVGPSLCDYAGALGMPDTFAVFMDLAAEHAETLGVGLEAMTKAGLFWLTVKTRVHFYRRPRMGETITAETWPMAPDRLRCIRNYTLSAGDELLAAGKTEWMVLNRNTGRLQPTAELFSPELVFSDRETVPEAFAPVRPHAPETVLGDYTVRSTDIDVGGHMNNVAYLRAFAGLLPVERWNALPCRVVDISYKAQCFEGERLEFRQETEPGRLLVQALDPAGKTAVQITLYETERSEP